MPYLNLRIQLILIAVGEMPNTLVKQRVKYFGSLKPTTVGYLRQYFFG